jgi:putative chitinase
MIDYLHLQRSLGPFYEGRLDGAPGKMTFSGIFAYAAGRMSQEARELGAAAVIAFPKYGCDSPLRMSFAVAEVSHETGDYTAWEEDLDRYTPANILRNWGPGKGGRVKTLAEAQALVRAGPQAIANKVYDRPQFGNTSPGDGWKYRGRGANMQTFKGNYQAAQDHTGIPFVEHPELMAQPGPSLHVAGDFWNRRGCWTFADKNDPAGWRKITNGGTIGLPDFAARTRKIVDLF